MKKSGWLRKAVAYVLSFCMFLSGLFVAEPVQVRAEGTTTVYFLNTNGWTDIKAHAWIPEGDGGGDLLGTWPGTSAVLANEVGSNWWKVTVPRDVSERTFNIMFTDNGSETSRMTAFIDNQNNVYLTTETDKSYSSANAAEQAVGVGASGDITTLYFLNSKGWSDVYGYIYVNQAPVGSQYPGEKAERAPEKGENWWKLTVDRNTSGQAFNVIFNDGGDANQADAYITDANNVYITAAGEQFSTVQAAEQAAGIGSGNEGSGEQTGGSKTLYFLNTENWSNIYAYTYANGADIGAAWPGTEAERAPEKGENWWKVTVTADSAFSVVFHDNGGSGRTELLVNDNTYITSAGAAYATQNEAEVSAGIGDLSNATTVYFKNSKGWLNVYGYVYYNDTPIGPSWPGTKASAASEKGENWWKIIVPRNASSSPFAVIFNDGNANKAEVEISNNSGVYVTPAGEKFDDVQAADEATAGDVGGNGGTGDVGVNPDLDYDVDLSGAGAALPYTTYEAENASTNAQVLKKSTTYLTDIQSEASGRSAVKLANTGDYVEFTLTKPANAFVVRFNMLDSADGAGIDANLSLYVNGKDSKDLALTSKYAWIYGSYPYTNSPGQGKGHRFFDETRAFFSEGELPAGTKIKLQKDAGDTASHYIIDFIECELVDTALAKPAESLSITDYGAVANDGRDDSEAILKCIEAAKSQNKEVWIPAGTFDLPAKKSFDVSDVTIRGAGMWYSNLSGAGASFHYQGTCKFYDFAMTGVSTVRDDAGDLAAFEGTGYATNVTIENVWIEHVKVGLWSYNTTNLVVQGCRIRNTYADGINLCSATNNATVRNNSLRNTGDDCIAIWPWQGDSCNNTIAYNTVQCPTLANGIALYGGSGNKVEYNHVSDSINNGSGICVGTNYDTPNGFTGTTTVSNNVLVRCGSYHCDYDYQIGAIWIWATKTPMTAIFDIKNNTLYDCSYEGVLIDCWNAVSGLNIKDNNIYGASTDGVFVRGDKSGTATIENLGVAEYGGELLKNMANNFTVTQSGSGIHDTKMPEPEQPTEQPTENPTEGTTEQPTENPTEGTTEQPTENPTEGTTEQPTENPTEGTTEQPTENPTEGTTEQPSENSTEGTTEQPTENPTEGTTEQPSEKPTEGTTEQPADTSQLDGYKEVFNQLVEENYTAESWNALKDALDAASKLTENSTQAEIDAAAEAIQKALEALERKQAEPGEDQKADLTMLRAYLSMAEKVTKDHYTEESYRELEIALTHAKAITEENTQEEVDTAATAILRAYRGLVKKQDENVEDPKEEAQVSEIRFQMADYQLMEKASIQLALVFTPNNAANKTVTYLSSNEKVAVVSKTGVVTGVSAGTAKITATTANGKQAVCTVTVSSAVSSILLNVSKKTLGVKEKFQLAAAVYPLGAVNTAVKYTSLNPKVAAVDANGKITAKKRGTTFIEVSTANGVKATCKITVKKAPKYVRFTAAKLTIKKGKTLKLKAKLSKKSAGKITYTSSKKGVVKVDASGKIKALKKGKAVITAKTYNKKKAKITIYVR